MRLGIVDQLTEVLASTALLVDALSPTLLGRATPCAGWTVLDVVNHLAAVTEKFGRFAAGEAGPVAQSHGDLVGPDPGRTFRAIAEGAGRAWRRNPEALGTLCVLPFGSFDGVTAAGINLFDAIVHQWDIAVGAGVAHEMREDLAVVALAIADVLITDGQRSSGQYAAPVETAPGAPPSVRLLAATGRDPRRWGAGSTWLGDQ